MLDFGRKMLLRLPPELAHDVSLWSLELAARTGVARRMVHPIYKPVELLGLRFRNRVGLAAGLDKDARALRGMFAMGFGFVEVGTLTPRPQPGNAKPRLFRLTAEGALINRMGFNNAGADAARARLRRFRQHCDDPGCVVGVNIGKNRDTPLERAQDDYLAALETLYRDADYVTVNLSSPNTPGLRELQHGAELEALLSAVLTRRNELLREPEAPSRLPVLAKIAPDLDAVEIERIAEVLLAVGVDGVIATNTTITRPLPPGAPHADEAGGLSGAPLNALSVRCVEALQRTLRGALPIIGVGGIHDLASAERLVEAGASLVQVYTGFIYRGPDLIRDIARALGPLR